MEVNELRIGNYILRLDLGNSYERIESIIELRKDKALTTGPISVMLLYDYIKPIPLTEEWLLKFGFVQRLKTDDCNFYENTKLSINIRSGYASVFLKQYKQDSYLISIEYVHQLQNLYFALTGKELTIK